jgi:hypothetical protein
MTRLAAKSAFQQAKITPKDVSIAELHDCFTTNQMCALEGLGLAAEGKAWKLIQNGGISYSMERERALGGKGWIVNPSGGLISKGHPLGATGLAQCAELVSSSSFPFSLRVHWLKVLINFLLWFGTSVVGQRHVRSQELNIACSIIWALVVPRWLLFIRGRMERRLLR